MRWVCPHCRTQLATPGLGPSPSERLAASGPRPGWAYAQCFECKGFATVELATARAEAIGAASTSRASRAQTPVAPQAAWTPPPRPADLAPATIAPVVRMARPQTPGSAAQLTIAPPPEARIVTPPPFRAPVEDASRAPIAAPIELRTEPVHPPLPAFMTAPLPEYPDEHSEQELILSRLPADRHSLLRFALGATIATAGVLAVAVGATVYLQSSRGHSPRAALPIAAHAPRHQSNARANTHANAHVNAKVSSKAPQQTGAQLERANAAADRFASAQPLPSPEVVQAPTAAAANGTPARAAARANGSAAPQGQIIAPAKPGRAPATADTPGPATPESVALAAVPPRAREVDDTIRSSAMAPVRPGHPEQDIQLYLQARKGVRSLELREGPGSQFALFGLADLKERYPVVEWKDRWFRIQLEETPGLTAWVQYERIELFSDDLDLVEPDADTPPARFYQPPRGAKKR